MYLPVVYFVLFAFYSTNSLATEDAIDPNKQISILAEPNLSVVLSLLARDFTKDEGIALSSSFGATKAQSARIVEEGVEADIFITTNEKVLQDLKNRGVVDVYSQAAIAKNRLVLATAQDNSLQLRLDETQSITPVLAEDDPEFTLAIGDPEFLSVGSHSLSALRYLNMEMDVEPHLLFLDNERDLHRSIETKGGYGFIYQSELPRNKQLRALDIVPEAAHRPVVYYAVVVAGENMDEARNFMSYLNSIKARDIIKANGFDLP